jgi:Fis family transcriptional regulator
MRRLVPQRPARERHLANDHHSPTQAPSAGDADDANLAIGRTLAECVEQALLRYFDLLDGQPAAGLYALVLNEMEAPLLRTVLAHVGDNQCRAAELLGINRGTLRKKMKLHGLL